MTASARPPARGRADGARIVGPCRDRARRLAVHAVAWLAIAGCAAPARDDARDALAAESTRATAPAPDAPTPGADAGGAPIRKVEHFLATSSDAERMFHFLRDTLALPEVWPFQDWGGFGSGGVTLGNVVFEVVRDRASRTPAAFRGIALEPVGTTDALLAALTRRGVAHDRPDSSVRRNLRGERVGWVNTGLPALSPWSVFVCDYQQRPRVARGRAAAASALVAAGGGPLGVEAVAELVLGATDVEAARRAWSQLGALPAPGGADDVLAFANGPRIRLVRADTSRIRGIVLAVRSLTTTRRALAARGLLGSADDRRVSLAPAALGGLEVTLEER